jgi:hypothetical protein
MSGDSDVTVVNTLVCFFILHARLRAHRAPGIPCALCFRGEGFIGHNSGASRRGNANARLNFPGCLKIESVFCIGAVGCAKRSVPTIEERACVVVGTAQVRGLCPPYGLFEI